MADKFNSTVGQTTPASSAFLVSPSDSTNFETDAGEVVPRAIYVGVAGDLKVDMINDGTVTFLNLPVGLYPFRVSKIYSTGTTCTSMIALY